MQSRPSFELRTLHKDKGRKGLPSNQKAVPLRTCGSYIPARMSHCSIDLQHGCRYAFGSTDHTIQQAIQCDDSHYNIYQANQAEFSAYDTIAARFNK